MDEKKNLLLDALCNSVLDMDEDLVRAKADEYLNLGYDAYDGIASGLAVGMDKAGILYEEEEYYIPELLMCSDAMYAGMDKFRPHLKFASNVIKHKAVVGVVEGDTHDIGKNLFKIMLETCGFEVHDLGRDVPPMEFINKVKETKATLVGMSTLMTTTMDNMKVVIDMLNDSGLRDNVVVMIGGGPISQSFADKIGADGYEVEASKAARLAKELVSRRSIANV